MMNFNSFIFSFSVILIHAVTIYGQRRITHGNHTTRPKRYMVYLVKAEESPLKYDHWICGGAIVSPSFIVTSAACVEDVQFMYAVAGYEKYVRGTSEEFAKDECIRAAKKKVIFTCTPKNYDFAYDEYSRWSNIDIALLKVESPYDFDGEKSAQVCSWVPGPIEISYDFKHMEAGRDAMVLGWGHAEKWRKPKDNKDYNSEHLKYASVLLLDKKVCKSMYSNLPEMAMIIEKYMVCSDKPGGIDDSGNQIDKMLPILDGCVQTIDPKTGRMSKCLDETGQTAYRGGEYDMPPGMRRSYNVGTNNSSSNGSSGIIINKSNTSSYNTLLEDASYSYGFYGSYSHKETRRSDPEPLISGPTRRHGICQNDHGGPLVTWVGSQEILIGAASVFLINNRSQCLGPYLYTSTQCNGAFLGCIIGSQEEHDEDEGTARRNWGRGFDPRVCGLPAQLKRFHIVQRRISWIGHPHGPAMSEMPDKDILDDIRRTAEAYYTNEMEESERRPTNQTEQISTYSNQTETQTPVT